MREARQTARPLLFFLGVSALIHGCLLWMAPVAERPAARIRDQGPRLALVNLPPPAPPRPALLETPAPSVAETPQERAPEQDSPAAEPDPEAAGAPGVSADPDPALREDAVSRYLALVRGRIDRCKVYPYQARRLEQEGAVLIRFTITRQGALAGEPALEKGSRHGGLNAAALEAVKNAAPYPPFPGEIGEDEMICRVAVVFSLKEYPQGSTD